MHLDFLVYHALSDTHCQSAFSGSKIVKIFPQTLGHNKILKESQFSSTDLVCLLTEKVSISIKSPELQSIFTTDENGIPNFRTFLAGTWYEGTEWQDVLTPIDSTVIARLPRDSAFGHGENAFDHSHKGKARDPRYLGRKTPFHLPHGRRHARKIQGRFCTDPCGKCGQDLCGG